MLPTVLDAEDVRALAQFCRQLLALVYRPGDEPPTDAARRRERAPRRRRRSPAAAAGSWRRARRIGIRLITILRHQRRPGHGADHPHAVPTIVRAHPDRARHPPHLDPPHPLVEPAEPQPAAIGQVAGLEPGEGSGDGVHPRERHGSQVAPLHGRVHHEPLEGGRMPEQPVVAADPPAEPEQDPGVVPQHRERPQLVVGGGEGVVEGHRDGLARRVPGESHRSPGCVHGAPQVEHLVPQRRVRGSLGGAHDADPRQPPRPRRPRLDRVPRDDVRLARHQPGRGGGAPGGRVVVAGHRPHPPPGQPLRGPRGGDPGRLAS